MADSCNCGAVIGIFPVGDEFFCDGENDMGKAHDTASNVVTEDGDVHVEIPNGVAYSMTPKAAAETSDRLREGSASARAQRREPTKLQRKKPVGDAEGKSGTSNEAGLRANDSEDLDQEEVTERRAPNSKTPHKTEIDEASAESAPELRDISMPGGVDHPDGRR